MRALWGEGAGAIHTDGCKRNKQPKGVQNATRNASQPIDDETTSTSTCGPFYTRVSGKSLTPGFLDTEPAVVGHFLSVALHWTPRKKMARNNRGTVVPARDLALGGAFTVYTVICSLVTLAT